MKTGMELVNWLRTDKTAAFNYSGEGADNLAYGAFDAGMAHATDILQAWLSEADGWSRKEEKFTGEFQRIRQKMLGTVPSTTQKPKQEGE